MTTDTMRVAVATRHGGPDVIELRELPVPQPQAGELLVEVAASGVNFIDVYKREGIYPTEPPFVLGGECAGRVIALGPTDSDATPFAVGDVVATAGADGTHAEFAVLPAAATVPVPADVSPEQAAAAMLQGMTAHYLVTSTFPIEAGHTALVHAAAGGVGQLLLQLITARGARAIATVGSAEKAEIARARGASEVLRYDELDTTEALANAVRDAAGGGVDVVYDGVGKATFDASLASLRPRGMLVLFGGASGQVPPFDLQRLNAGGSLYVTRPSLGHYVATPQEMRWRAGEVLGAVADGTLELAIGGWYPLADTAQAYRDLEARASTGKLLILP